MLDTHARKYVNPLISKVGDLMININLSPNKVTILAFLIGISTGLMVYLEYKILAIVLLWISGLLDAVDGYIARKKNCSTQFGTLMDITFDRIVELSIVIAIALRVPDSRIYLLFLVSSIVLSMTVFLTVGAFIEKSSEKSFYYQAGVVERTEGFILFTSMIVFKDYLNIIASLFTLLVTLTAVQRFLEGKRFLK